MKLKTVALTIAGILCLILGGVGVFLPILPTTPFVLVAASCFSFTPLWQEKILQAPFFKDYMNSYRKKEKLPFTTVFLSLLFLWGMVIFSIISSKKPAYSLFLIIMGMAVSVHILWMARRIKSDPLPSTEESEEEL